jgi:hypothetical protein
LPIHAALALGALVLLDNADTPAPPPSRTPVELVVSGRTSTLRSIVVEDVGDAIPATFARNVPNVEGFRWYVSRHYALQTDYDAERARHWLSLLELAYPHYVELFGREPDGIGEKRLAVVYGATRASLDRAMRAAGIAWDFNGGGITYEGGLNVAYQYPSGGLQYHQRYILLHEVAHLFQIVLEGSVRSTPSWYYEGVADAVAHHVWESATSRLTLGVLDKPTINNWYDDGLAELAAKPFHASDVLAERRGGRGLGFLLVNYFATEPARLARLRVWRDELFRLDRVDAWHADSARILGSLFGADELDRDFDRWLRERRSSFHYVDWGWEQDGDAWMSYGWPHAGTYSQTDLRFAPGDEPRFDPLVMDHPLHERSELVDAPQRGVAEPTVGCALDFRENPDAGSAGMALGVEGRTFATVLVDARRSLVVDASAIGGAKRTIEMSEEFRAATSRTYRIGVTLRIGRNALRVTARANDAGAMRSLEAEIPLEASERERLLRRPMAVISRDGRHWITPYVDDARHDEPDLEVPAPPNRWRNQSLGELGALARASFHLESHAPRALREHERDGANAITRGGAAASGARAKLRAALPRLRAAVRACGASEEAIRLALESLDTLDD